MANTFYGVLKKTSLEKRAGQKHPEDGLQTIGGLNCLILLEFVVSEIRFAKRLAQSREVAKKAQKLGVLGDFPSTAR